MNFKESISVIRRALRGEHHDYTKGPIPEAVVLLAIPMILEIGLESVFAVVDMFFVSGLGQNAIATVGLTESVVTLVYSVAIGLSTGATAVVARRVGEKHYEAASHAGAQAIVFSTVLSIFLGVIGFTFAGDILKVMGASPEVVSEGTSFARILLGGCTPIILLFLINGIFRGAGDAAMAMKSLWLASGINILLCPIFIHLFGLKGAAMATFIGRSSGVLYQCWHLFKGDGRIKMSARDFGFDPEIIKGIVKVAWPATVQFIIGSGSWIILTRLVAETGGTAASAGYQIAFRNFVFFILPAWGLSNAAATLMGQNLGANQIKRAEECVLVTARYSAIFMAFVSVFLFVLAGPIIGVFTHDEVVYGYGLQGLRIVATGFVFYGVAMVFTQALNGAGDTKTPTRINIVCFWLFQTPLAYYLVGHTSLKTAGVMAAIPISHLLLTGISYYFFKKGNWRTLKV